MEIPSVETLVGGHKNEVYIKIVESVLSDKNKGITYVSAEMPHCIDPSHTEEIVRSYVVELESKGYTVVHKYYEEDRFLLMYILWSVPNVITFLMEYVKHLTDSTHKDILSSGQIREKVGRSHAEGISDLYFVSIYFPI